MEGGLPGNGAHHESSLLPPHPADLCPVLETLPEGSSPIPLHPIPRGVAQAFTPSAPHHHQTVLQDVSWQGPQDLFLKSQVMPEPIPDSLNHEGGRVSLVLHQLLPSPRDSDAP